MSYEDIISQISEETGISRSKVKDVIEALGTATLTGLKDEGRVRIPAFGIFEMRTRQARTGRNPRTGEPLSISARQSVGFKMGARMKSSLPD